MYVYLFGHSSLICPKLQWNLQPSVVFKDTFITGGTQRFSITLLSINHYFCVVKNTWYERVYTTKNMSVSWLILFLFPLLDVLGRFTYDELRFICNQLLTNGSYRYFLGTVCVKGGSISIAK